jgi:diguanylate cyclase (GGDEF)-like protein
MNIRLSPVVRVSFGLLMLTISLLLIGDWLGLIPQAHKLEVESRKRLSQNLAVQLSSLAMSGEVKHIRTTLTALVERNEDVISAAFRSQDGLAEILVGEDGENRNAQQGRNGEGSYVSVPIFKGEESWGSVDVLFSESEKAWLPGYYDNTFVLLLLFVSVSGFVLYMMFLKRTLRQLDPRKVIPQRVRAAFDALAEGVLILDEHCNVVLANRAFSRHVDLDADGMMGRPADSLNWSTVSGEPISGGALPWERMLLAGEELTSGRLALFAGSEAQRNFAVNCTPIHDDRGNVRGAISTFDDLTELEQKNVTLQKTLSDLTRSKRAVDLKSKELEFLATRDPLTNCLNRRAFNEQIPRLFHEARSADKCLVCMMVDIDHFKRVNDNHGHSMGDKVIKFLAGTIANNIRTDDVLARFGGEEFCVIMSVDSPTQAKAVAERMRESIKAGDPSQFTASIRITASFGLAELDEDIDDHSVLVNRADKALYAAKAAGRDKVVEWSTLGADADFDSVQAEIIGGGSMPDKAAATLADDGADSESHDPMRDRVRELERIAEEKAQQLDHYFSHDSLTNLPTRRLFEGRLEQAILVAEREESVVAVISLGLDGLARINATLGHEYAEEMLRETARRLKGVLRATDSVSLLSDNDDGVTLSKLSDGEFGVLLSSIKDNESITWIVQRMFDVLNEPFFIKQHSLSISSSIGIAAHPTDGKDVVTLMQKASISLYYADEQPGNNVVKFYSEEIDRLSREQLQIQSELVKAIENEDFLVYYQPQIDLAKNAIIGFEALIRWNHPSWGFLPPGEFIDVAEHSRLINTIGDWVLRESCTQLRKFQQYSSESLKMSVNISPVQLSQPQLVERILSILDECGLEPEHLELELTETCLMENIDSALHSLKALHRAGIGISIDDFGTGYSALSYLRTLPVDTLKVDRAFVADIDTSSDDHAIISAILSLAASLGLRVIAEGVETHNQLNALVAMDCAAAQGYLFSRPVPAGEMIAYLLKHGGDGLNQGATVGAIESASDAHYNSENSSAVA